MTHSLKAPGFNLEPSEKLVSKLAFKCNLYRYATSYLRTARTNEPELAAAVKSEETARRLLAVAERSAKAGLCTS